MGAPGNVMWAVSLGLGLGLWIGLTSAGTTTTLSPPHAACAKENVSKLFF